jgi:hypothetical protein
MKLEYQISADSSQLKRVFRSVEGEVRNSAKRTAREQSSGRQQDAHVRARLKAIQAGEQAEKRSAERTQRYWETAARRAADARIRESNRAERIAERERRRSERVAERMRVGMARTAAGSVVGSVRTIAGVGGAAAGVAGGFAAAAALDDALQTQRKAQLLAVKAGRPGDRDALIKMAGGVTGFAAPETLDAMDAMMGKTGNLDAAMASIPELGKIALVTGANFAEMGEAAGHAFNLLKDSIKDPIELQTQLSAVMQNAAVQGNLGTVEMKDLAKIGGRLGAASRAFAGNPSDLFASMGALAQLAAGRGGASSADEAGTAVARFGQDIVKNRKEFGKRGIDIFSDKTKTKLKDPQEILLDVLGKTKGDLTQVMDLFNLESIKAFQGIAPIFTDAEAKKKGSGREAVKAELARFAGAKFEPGALDAQVAAMASTTSVQIIEATKAFNEAIGRELLPVVTKTIPQFTKMIPTLAKATDALARFAGFILDNPVQGIGAIIAAKLTADLAGNFLRDSLEKSIGAGGGLKFGSVAIAASSVILAAQQYSELSTQTEGFGGIVAGIGALMNGESFAKGVSDFQDEKARARFADPFSPESVAAREAARKSEGTGFKPGLIAPLPPSAPRFFAQAVAATSPQPAATPASMAKEFTGGGSPALDASAAKLDAVVLKLGSAADALKGAAGHASPSSPARNGPINTRQ